MSRWTRFDDNWPEIGKECIVLSESYGKVIAVLESLLYWNIQLCNITSVTIKIKLDDVTHWMPSPEDPED